MPKSVRKKSSESTKKKSVNRVVILGGFGFFILIYIFLRFYTPPSTLQWEERAEGSPSLREFCKEVEQIYPPTSRKWPFPALSPDGKYYIDVTEAKLGHSKVLKLYRADTNQELGRYYSERSNILIYCWLQDSTGVYLADYDPGSGSFDIGGAPTKISPVKKLLVP